MGQHDQFKPELSRSQRLKRLILSVIDPRAWAHMFKVVNYYNYSHVAERRKAHIAPDVRISPMAQFANAHNVEIGQSCEIGAGCFLWAGQGSGKIILGQNVLIGPNVMITAASYNFRDGSPVTEQAMSEASITIGRDVWIGYGAVVLMGSTVGDGAIIAANSVVRGDVEAGSVMAGNLAKKVSTRTLSS